MPLQGPQLLISDLPTEVEIDAELSRTLRGYVEAAWHVVEPATPFRPNWHIDAICEHLEAVSAGAIRRLIINIPPRTMKSLSVDVFWPTWEWLFNPSYRWLFTSYAESLALRDSLKCRRIIESAWYQGVLAELCRQRDKEPWALVGDQNEKRKFENSAAGVRYATGFAGGITGEGGDAVVADDPHKVRGAQSDLQRENDLEVWDTTLSTRLNDPRTGVRVVVMQRVHEADLTGHILAKSKEYVHLCLPMRYERSHPFVWPDDPRSVEGELLWPERVPEEAVSELERELGGYGAAGQLQQRPAPAEGGIFKRSWWRFYVTPEWLEGWIRSGHARPEDVHEVLDPGSLSELIQSWDMAFKDESDSDYVVGQVWGRRGSEKFLLDQTRDIMDMPGTCRAVIQLTGAWPRAGAKVVEDKANGPAVMQTLRRVVSGLVKGDGQFTAQGKLARARATSPQVEAGNVYLPHPLMAPWVHEYIEEHASFPNAANDDQVDATTQALHRLDRGGIELGPSLWT